MKKLNNEEVMLLEALALLEANLINKAFNISEARGLMHLSNALTSFEQNFIVKKYGEVVVSMCSEYRVFLIELLKLIREPHRDTVLNEVLIPKVKSITDEDIFSVYGPKA